MLVDRMLLGLLCQVYIRNDVKCLADMKGGYGYGGTGHKMKSCSILMARGRELGLMLLKL